MKKYRLSVCKGPDCRRRGADAVFAAAKEALVEEKVSGKCEAYRGGCYGLCDLGPNVVIRPDTGKPRDFLSQEDFQLMGWEGEVYYGAMTPLGIKRVVTEHIGKDTPVEDLRCEAPPELQPTSTTSVGVGKKL